MQDTWNLFTGNDVALAVVGFAGFFSVVAILNTAFRTMNRTEIHRSSSRVTNDAVGAIEDFIVYETLFEGSQDTFDSDESFDFDLGDD